MKQLFFVLMIVGVLGCIACDTDVALHNILESGSTEVDPLSLKAPLPLPLKPPSAVVHRDLSPDVLRALRHNAEKISWFIKRLRTDETFLSNFNPAGVKLYKDFLLVEKGLTDGVSIHEWQKEFYTRYIDAGGVAIIGTETVTDREYILAREAILVMTSKRPELRDRVQVSHGKFYMILVSDYPEATGIPERLDPPSDGEYALASCNGGFGPRTDAVDGWCWAPVIRDGLEHPMQAFVHEFAHAIDEHKYALDPTHRERLKVAFETSTAEGTWWGTDIARPSDFEYWAHAVTAWFFDIGWCNPLSEYGYGVTYTYADFYKRDPRLVTLLMEWFPPITLTRPGDIRQIITGCRTSVEK